MTLLQTVETYATDALRAFPAALARVLLGWKAEPNCRVYATTSQKASALIGSVALAIMCGDLARINYSTAPYCAMIVIAVAFNAQHTAAKLIAISNPILRYLDRQARQRLSKRYRDDDDHD